MTDLKTMWARATPGARAGLLIGVLAIGLAMAVFGRWALAKEYQALFTGLSDQDASTMVAELDRMKVPYRLEANGASILVPQELVHKTRLQLVGKNLPLHGTVGFEIFNNTDFGMTEFTQKVNYQRALQGELTRTIMALDEVQSARVHLALPESSLFKREQNRPKASVTLAVKPGQSLGRDQVGGIQRLIAAAVPGIEMADVTVLDQKGVTLSRRGETGGDGDGWQLETKQQIEGYLGRKVASVLDRAFGPGQGVVSVDVALNFDHVKVTSEEVLPAKGAVDGAAPSGVVVRERQTQRTVSTGRDGTDGANSEGAPTNLDVEYQTGRRVEQIVGTPGSVRRINVGVVVPRGITQDRLDRVREVVAMAAGLDKQRGDGIAVYSLDQVSDGPPLLKATEPTEPPAVAHVPHAPSAQPSTQPDMPDAIRYLALALLGAAGLLVVSRLLLRRRPALAAAPVARLPLAETERAALLQNMQLWLAAAPLREEREPAE
ncbi:MAG TPA: flagellar basal-body MS-ring/collar protein FliF [Burkholderiaceae bacterium]|nr:flagellar basal-body MS-ring/collar protein FliF [Burkholderiaceae bacterium]